jgi:hypothetical protein
MNKVWLWLIVFIFSGCNKNNIDYTLARIAGNKPMKLFHFTNSYDANHYIFHRKDYDLHMPTTDCTVPPSQTITPSKND